MPNTRIGGNQKPPVTNAENQDTKLIIYSKKTDYKYNGSNRQVLFYEN